MQGCWIASISAQQCPEYSFPQYFVFYCLFRIQLTNNMSYTPKDDNRKSDENRSLFG